MPIVYKVDVKSVSIFDMSISIIYGIMEKTKMLKKIHYDLMPTLIPNRLLVIVSPKYA